MLPVENLDFKVEKSGGWERWFVKYLGELNCQVLLVNGESRTVDVPDDMPDLRTLRPPGGNSQSRSEHSCYLARRESGSLPATY